MRLAIRHTTRYEFSEPVYYGLQRLRLTPKPTHGQKVIDWDMAFEGAQFQAEYDDHQRNRTTLISVEPGTKQVAISCTGTVETSDHSGILGQHGGYMPLWCYLRPTRLTQPGPKTRALVSKLGGSGQLDQLHALSAAILDAMQYEAGTTDATTTGEAALDAGRGVCQDHAHVFISAARLMDVPARYVSGYLLMDGTVKQDAGHGWVEAHVDGLGWVGFDVSNAISPDERYVRVATGCDYSDAAPLVGLSLGNGESTLSVSLSVEQQQQSQ